MKQYSILQPIYLSFYSRDLYRDVAKNWKGTGFLYLFLLLALTWMPVMARVHGAMSDEIRREAPKYIEQVPKITITRGTVAIDRPVPYTIADPEGGAPLMVIDTSGRITSIDQTAAPVLLTANKFIYRQPNRAETRIYDLSAVEEFAVDKNTVGSVVEAFRKFFSIVAYPVALLGSFVYRILQMLIYAAIGMLFVNQLKAQLEYQDLLRLASVSITPVILLSTLRTLANITIPFFWLICFAIAMGYLYFAVKVSAEPERPGTMMA